LAVEASISQGCLELVGVAPLIELLDERQRRRAVVSLPIFTV
jgi:hypothetical protein